METASGSFTEWLALQRRGDLAEELTESLAKLNLAVVSHNKPGSLTLTIRIEPQDGAMGTVFVRDEIKVKAPEAGRPATIWYVNADGYGLQRNDPRQMRLDTEIELARGNITSDELPPVGTADGEVPE